MTDCTAIRERLDGIETVHDDETRAHLETCSACATYAEEVSVLRETFGNWGVAEPPPAVDRAVMRAVTPMTRPRAPWWPTAVRAPVAAALVLAVGVCAFLAGRASVEVPEPATAPPEVHVLRTSVREPHAGVRRLETHDYREGFLAKKTISVQLKD